MLWWYVTNRDQEQPSLKYPFSDVCCINVGSMPNVCITNSDGSPKCCNPLDPSCRSAPTSKSTPPPPITTVTTTTKETSTVKTTESPPPPPTTTTHPAPPPPLPTTTTHPAPPPPTTTHSSSTPTTTPQAPPSTSAAPSSTPGTALSTPGTTSSTPIATSPTANQIPDFTQSFAPAPSQGSTTTNVTVSANDPNITVAGPFWTNSTSICDNNTPCKKNSVAGQALSYRFVGELAAPLCWSAMSNSAVHSQVLQSTCLIQNPRRTGSSQFL